ncbi:hypothetical protein NLI96_g5000 [Meripilus lineatus]|uniref:GDP-Man:Man(3)GlcNAc(2)-PP-Dol alpha-1,2-mannosyltransferase n=1 Tax=Meripilus lineatus TaxID=2056292 RepID=A0AAD5YEA7_9APHY|nr:hypothetical protein NLI96_g5000 [Physisporinus lineatus]
MLWPFLIVSSALLLWIRAVINKIRNANAHKRRSILQRLGVSRIDETQIVGFFHPYCDAGGGGERVLWTAIALLQRTQPDVARFAIQLSPSTLHFVMLNSRYLVEDSTWPRFTILGQSIGSVFLAWEAMLKLIPDLFIDTMGYAFSFHVVSLLGNIPVGAYVHYPTLSTDMLERVKSRKTWHTNSDTVSSSSILSRAKLFYYRVFMYYYSLSLRQASFLMVNSSWTKGHVDTILQHSDSLLDFLHLLPPFPLLRFLLRRKSHKPPSSARIVYPPCDTREMTKFPLGHRERIILSIAQFRPEKDHPMQLRSFQRFLQKYPECASSGDQPVTLVMIGGSRNAEDAARVEALKAMAREMDIHENVKFIVNTPYPDMLKWLSKASIGLSTMVDEHFGISVVEFMAAGAIPVTHASGGPLNDIVVNFNGLPTDSPETFAEAFEKVLDLAPEEELALRTRTRTWAVQRFSQEEFERGWDASGWKDWLPKRELR